MTTQISTPMVAPREASVACGEQLTDGSLRRPEHFLSPDEQRTQRVASNGVEDTIPNKSHGVLGNGQLAAQVVQGQRLMSTPQDLRSPLPERSALKQGPILDATSHAPADSIPEQSCGKRGREGAGMSESPQSKQAKVFTKCLGERQLVGCYDNENGAGELGDTREDADATHELNPAESAEAPQHVARVKQAIEDRGIPQSQAALEIGCSSSTLSKWLRGLTDSPRLDIVVDAQAAVWLRAHGFLDSDEGTVIVDGVEEPKSLTCHHCGRELGNAGSKVNHERSCKGSLHREQPQKDNSKIATTPSPQLKENQDAKPSTQGSEETEETVQDSKIPTDSTTLVPATIKTERIEEVKRTKPKQATFGHGNNVVAPRPPSQRVLPRMSAPSAGLKPDSRPPRFPRRPSEFQGVLRSDDTQQPASTGRAIKVNILQGGSREGWIRSNDRTMVMGITLSGLPREEIQQWEQATALKPPQEPSDSTLAIDVQLVYEDLSPIELKRRGAFPDRMRIVKFDGSVKAPSDVLHVPGNLFTIQAGTDVRLKLKLQDGTIPEWEPWQIVRVGTSGIARGELDLSVKLTTNITTKSHGGKKFVFAVVVRRIGLDGQIENCVRSATSAFELIAKHKMAGTPPVDTAGAKVPATLQPSPPQPMGTQQEYTPAGYSATWERFVKAVSAELRPVKAHQKTVLNGNRTQQDSSKDSIEHLKTVESQYSRTQSKADYVQMRKLPDLALIIQRHEERITKCRRTCALYPGDSL